MIVGVGVHSVDLEIGAVLQQPVEDIDRLIHQHGLVGETERSGDTKADLVGNIGERDKVSQPLPRLQADRQRQPAGITAGVAADEEHLLVAQG